MKVLRPRHTGMILKLVIASHEIGQHSIFIQHEVPATASHYWMELFNSEKNFNALEDPQLLSLQQGIRGMIDYYLTNLQQPLITIRSALTTSTIQLSPVMDSPNFISLGLRSQSMINLLMLWSLIWITLSSFQFKLGRTRICTSMLYPIM